MNLIEQLKDNEAHTIFIDMLPEERECLRAEAKKGHVQFLNYMMKWTKTLTTGKLCNTSIYRIDPSSYKPGPEYVDVEIVALRIGYLGINIDNGSRVEYLHQVPSLPDFFCFWQEENNEGYKDTEHISFEVVATAINGGNKVYARFRKAL